MEQNIPKYREPNRRRIAKTIAIAGVLVVLGLILVFSSFYELNEDEFAVITTFGKALLSLKVMGNPPPIKLPRNPLDRRRSSKRLGSISRFSDPSVEGGTGPQSILHGPQQRISVQWV